LLTPRREHFARARNHRFGISALGAKSRHDIAHLRIERRIVEAEGAEFVLRRGGHGSTPKARNAAARTASHHRRTRRTRKMMRDSPSTTRCLTSYIHHGVFIFTMAPPRRCAWRRSRTERSATCSGLGAIPCDGAAIVSRESRVDHRASSLLAVHAGTIAIRASRTRV
jgi:hypothetical protein